MADVYFHYRKSGAVVDQAARGLSENELTLQMANSLIGQMAQFLPTESGHGESFNSQTAFQIDILAAAPT